MRMLAVQSLGKANGFGWRSFLGQSLLRAQATLILAIAKMLALS